MWKIFKNNEELYMIKVKRNENIEIFLTDLRNIWTQNMSKESVLIKFQEINPLFDIKNEEAVTQVTGLVDCISDIDTELSETSEGIQLSLKSEELKFPVKFKFDLEKAPTEIFLKEVTVPLIQTVKHLEQQQKMLCNMIHKKDRELEEYKLEKGQISREDLITEKFEEDLLDKIDNKSMMNVFGNSKLFWETFVEQHGDLATRVEDVKMDPWNHIKRKRKIYSSKTTIKKGKGINYNANK